MNKGLICVLSLVMAFCFLIGCSKETEEIVVSRDSSSTVSALPQKDEVELALEGTLWCVNDQFTYLLFHDGKEVSEYDLSLLDDETEEIEKCLSYAIETNAKAEKTVYFPYLLGKNDLRWQYQSKTKTVVPKDDTPSIKQVSMRTFIDEFVKKIQAAGKEKQWESQAEMNVAAGVRCNYWDTLYQAIDYYLKATLSVEEYAVFESETKAFETARQTAMDTAGKDVEGGSLYPVVTGGAYCTQTEKEIQNILTKYFS